MRVDSRSPYVINTHDLGRRPGSMRTREMSVPAPTDLGVELLGVPEGSPVQLQLRLEAVMEGVLVSGSARAQLTGECGRCLAPIEDDLEVELQELYVYPESDAEEDEASRLEGELLDLEPVLRDSVVLALPFQPVCRPDCQGLCLECGARLDDHPGHQHTASVDPRWASLAALKTDDAAAITEMGSEDEE
ncbi:MAG: YceD family protein [Nocardioidaceae bacterium]